MIDTSDGGGDCAVQVGETLPVIDDNADGKIQIEEMRDERIAWITRFGPTNGLGRSLCIGTDGHLWAGDYSNRTYYKISSADGSVLAGPIAAGARPYGCLVDGDGILWGATLSSALIELDTLAETPGVTHSGGRGNYGIALGNDKVYLGSANQEFDPATNTFTYFGGPGTNGISVDGDGNIVYGRNPIRKMAPDFTVLWEVPNPAGSPDIRGVIVDSDNNIWLNNLTNSNVIKLDGATGAHLATVPVGNSPYTYSDATGFAARNVTNPTGTWTVVKDTGSAGTELQSVSWTADVPAGASVEVEVRVADTEAGLVFAAYQTVSNGAAIAGVTGQFIQVRARLTANDDDLSPELLDLTIEFGGQISNEPPTVDGDGPFDVDEGSDVVVSATASDPDGDALSWEWFVDENGDGVIDAGDTPFSTDESPTYSGGIDGPDTHQLLVRVTDPDGESATDTVTVNVLNVDPTIDETIGDNGVSGVPADPIPVGTEVMLELTHSDPALENDEYTENWEWGDGSPSTSEGTHTYTEPGLYQVTVTVDDGDGGSDSTTTSAYIVVYDPSGGFVTGGGFIDSPPGAYLAEPTLEGTANFGFNSKYKKGANVPDGSTQFQFQTAGLNFHSNTYEWLVVAGAKAQFKGSGTVNGEPGFSFMLTAADGDLKGDDAFMADGFRIKIWNDGGVIYDNGVGLDDTADPQDIRQGSIVIHEPKGGGKK